MTQVTQSGTCCLRELDLQCLNSRMLVGEDLLRIWIEGKGAELLERREKLLSIWTLAEELHCAALLRNWRSLPP